MEAYCMAQEVYREMEVDAYYNYLDNMEADGKSPLDFKAWKAWLTEKVPEAPQVVELEDANAPGYCPF